MKNILFALSILVALGSCGDKNADGTSTNGSDYKPASLMELTGQYDGKHPCTGCDGLEISLVINPDSTFQIKEIYRNAAGGDSVAGTNGTFSVNSDLSQLILKPSKGATAERTVDIVDGLIVKLQAAGGDAMNALQRTTRVFADEPNHRVIYKITEPDSVKNLIYQLSAGRFVSIHKTYLDKAPEGERAIAAFYASVFDTGCSGDNCDLSTALGIEARNSSKHTDMISKFVNADSLKQLLGTLASAATKLTTLQMSNTRGMLKYSYLVESADGNKTNCIDSYEASDKGHRLVSHTVNEMNRSMSPGAKQIQQMRPDPKGDPRRPANQNNNTGKSNGKHKVNQDPGTIISPQPLPREKN
ncbi:MAG: copper resistance protein NlpE N-terminal domain-containing protein [Flavobacteriales bacterium]|nr:copper resistance protein NlpE N-terminal domain-containing protein [Flavobacteriales bacterium]